MYTVNEQDNADGDDSKPGAVLLSSDVRDRWEIRATEVCAVAQDGCDDLLQTLASVEQHQSHL